VGCLCSLVIDSTFLFEAAHRVAFGAPLIVVDGKDHTFLFCIIRDLLRLRQMLGFDRCVIVVGGDAYQATSPSNVEETVSFLREFGVPVVHEPRRRVLDICTMLAPSAERFVTRSLNLLVLVDDQRAVIIVKSKNETAILDSTAVTSSFGICPACIPAFLALTHGEQSTVLRKRLAVSLLQRHPKLSEVLDDPSVVSSREIRYKLRENKAVIAERLAQFTPIATGQRIDSSVEQMVFNIDNDCSADLLQAHQFHSLVRLLPRQPSVQAHQPTEVKCSTCYQAVTTPEGIQSLLARIRSAKACAVDTESSGKDPHQAELFGVSFSVKKGEAFYVPVVSGELNDGAGSDAVLESLRDIFNSGSQFVGHNLKYDYVLLRRYGLEIPGIDFDTMLAAHECFGDWEFLNLSFVAKKLLGKNMKSYHRHPTV
jgi:hypothetical protein